MRQKFYFHEIQFSYFFKNVVICALDAQTKDIVPFKDTKACIIFVPCNPFVSECWPVSV